MPAAARPRLMPLGGEARALAAGLGEVLDAGLVDDVPIRALERRGGLQRDLRLPRSALALGRFDRDAGGFHAGSDGAHQAFLRGGLEDLVILGIEAVRHEVAIALRP